MATVRKKPAVRLTPAEIEIAKNEVAAFYDEAVTQAEAAVEAARAALNAAEVDFVAASGALATWIERGEITAPAASPRTPTQLDFQILISEIAQSAGGRALRLAQPIVTARFGDATGGGRRAVSGNEQLAAEDAFARAEILERWLRESGYPMLDSRA